MVSLNIPLILVPRQHSASFINRKIPATGSRISVCGRDVGRIFSYGYFEDTILVRCSYHLLLYYSHTEAEMLVTRSSQMSSMSPTKRAPYIGT